MTATVLSMPSASARPVRRTLRHRLIAMVEQAMLLQPGIDAVLVITDQAGQVKIIPSAGTPQCAQYGLLVYAVEQFDQADE